MVNQDNHILIGPRVGAAIGLFGPSGIGLALMAIVLPHLSYLFWFGFCVALLGAGGAVWLAYSETKKKTKAGFLLAFIAALEFFAPISVLIYALNESSPVEAQQVAPSSPSVPVDEVLPGFSFSAVFSMSDIAELSRQYVFEYATPEGAKVAFYLSASDRFTFSVTDRNGESYPVTVPLGKYGIPINREIVLYCDVGSGSNYAFMRVFVNDKQILRQDYQHPIDMGSRQWNDGTLGANMGYSNRASFQMSEIITQPQTLAEADLQALTENEMNFYHIKDLPTLPPPVPEPQ